MKKLLSLLTLLLIAVLALAACGRTPPKSILGTPANPLASDTQTTEAAAPNNPGPGSAGEASAEYFNIIKKGIYHLKISIEVEGIDPTIADYYMRDGEFVTVSESKRMVFSDQTMHVIDDQEKTIISYPSQPTAEHGPVTRGGSFTGSGTEEFKGTNLHYDEYAAEDGKTRYFINNGKLVGLRAIKDDGAVTDLTILECDQNVPDSLFAIPDDYTELGS